MFVADILKTKGRKVHSVKRSTTVRDAVALLSAHNIGAVVVVDSRGKLVGILSERDVIRRLHDEPQAVLTRTVGEYMTDTVFTVTPDTAIATVMEDMTDYRVRHLPVVEENGELIGIISIGDVVKRKIEEAEQEALHLREYISSGIG